MSATAASLLDVLDGKAAGGKPKSAPERSGMLAGVQALAAAPGSSSSMHDTAEAVVTRLLAIYKAEANEEVSMTVSVLAAQWSCWRHHIIIYQTSTVRWAHWCMFADY